MSYLKQKNADMDFEVISDRKTLMTVVGMSKKRIRSGIVGILK